MKSSILIEVTNKTNGAIVSAQANINKNLDRNEILFSAAAAVVSMIDDVDLNEALNAIGSRVAACKACASEEEAEERYNETDEKSDEKSRDVADEIQEAVSKFEQEAIKEIAPMIEMISKLRGVTPLEFLDTMEEDDKFFKTTPKHFKEHVEKLKDFFRS